MDRYGFNVKVEQIKKMINRRDYGTAMKTADTIDWHRVQNVNILSMVTTIYEKNEEYQGAKDILLLVFERAPIGKRLLSKLTKLTIKKGNFREAKDYYRGFCDLASDGPRQYVLHYLILGVGGAPAEQLIHTLEQYCNIELDEKWLYELAELYAKASMGELCIMACDEIIFMFDPGKYMGKVMELKIQSAPLAKHQMGLVENRNKYGARLKAMEQEYRTGERPADYEPMFERKTEVSPQSYIARQEAAFAVEPEARYPEGGYAQAGHRESGYAEDDYAQTGHREAGYTEEEYPEDDYSEGDYQKNGYQAEVYQEDTYTDEDDSRKTYGWWGHYGNEYPDQNPQDNIEDGAEAGYSEEHCGNATGAEKSYEDEDAHARVTIELEDSGEEEKSVGETQSQWVPDKPQILSDGTARARMHKAEVQTDLAEEISRISDGRHGPETTSAQTRALADIKDLGRGLSVQEPHYFMIETEYSSSGLDQAIELFKEIHKETGAENQTAKITGEKSNSKGVLAITDKLTGKGLAIEQVGVMEEPTLQELNQLMTRDEIGISVILMDVAGNLARIHRVYLGLAERFEYVGKTRPGEVAYVAPEGDDHSVRLVQSRKAEKPAAPRKVQGWKGEPAVSKTQLVPEPAAPKSLSKPESEQRPDTDYKAKIEQKPNSVRRKVEESRSEPIVHREEHKGVPFKTAEDPPVLPQSDESDYDDRQEMDTDESAQYACQYTSDIDCNISEKNMLVLYGWIEVMEEDDVPLTEVNAEDLIEETADRAENPPLSKRITGTFSPKCDRDGLLTLGGEHFIR